MKDPLGRFRCENEHCRKDFRMEPGQHVTCPFCQSPYAVWQDWKRFVAAAEQARKQKRRTG